MAAKIDLSAGDTLPVTLLSQLPLVLAGPILRHTTNQEVNIWLALKQPYKVTATVYSSAGSAVGQGVADPSAAPSSPPSWVQVGQNLYLALVRVPFAGTWGQRYSYDLSFNLGTSTLTLSKALGTRKVTLGSQTRPFFELPPDDITGLRLFHGSCRRPLGQSVDVMGSLRERIEKALEGQERMPHQLVLGGDQIYADGVADALLGMIHQTELVLMGDWTSANVESAHPSTDPTNLELRPGFRDGLSIRTGFLETYPPCSHLMSFPEYVLMYLFVWSDLLWPTEAQLLALSDATVYGGPAPSTKKLEYPPTVQKEHLALFRRALPDVQIALAHIPTWMVFDDHDVTDDWNIHSPWRDTVLAETPDGPGSGSPGLASLGQRTLRAGMAAFCLCQAWGNPLSNTDRSALVNAVLSWYKLCTNQAGAPATARTTLDTLLGLGSSSGRPTVSFHFRVQGPRHEILALDIRTRRALSQSEPPGLIDPNELPAQINQGTVANNTEVVLVVSPTPVFGHPLVEHLQENGLSGKNVPYYKRYALNLLLIKAVTGIADAPLPKPLEDWTVERLTPKASSQWLLQYHDGEAWGLHTGSMSALLHLLARRKRSTDPHARVVLLSGDVHYGFAARTAYGGLNPYRPTHSSWSSVPAGSASAVFAQLTCSSLRNENGSFKDPTSCTLLLHWAGTVMDRVFAAGWKDKASTPSPAATASMKFYKNTLGIDGMGESMLRSAFTEFFPKQLQALRDPPVFHSIQSAFDSSGLDLIAQVDWTLSSTQPHWLYDTRFIPASPFVQGNIGLPPSDAAQATGLYLREKGGERVVGVNNLGEVSFTRSSNALSVVQTLWWNPSLTRGLSAVVAGEDYFDLDLSPAVPLSKVTVKLDWDTSTDPPIAPASPLKGSWQVY